MKTIWLIAAGTALITVACNTKHNTEEPTAQSNMDSLAVTTVSSSDKDFAMEAAGGGMMEVELGKIAMMNAQSQRVKDFGSMMVRDHSKANDQLKSIAGSKNIMLGDSVPSMHRHMIDDLKNKKGKEFDRSYMDMMVNDHQKDIDAFKKESENGGDTDLKMFATNTLPTLQTHLDSAQAIFKTIK